MVLLAKHVVLNPTKLLITRLSSFWSHVEEGPPDIILGITEAFKRDSNPNRINLGVGAYRDEQGKPYVLPCVRKAESQIFEELRDKEYAGITGVPDFLKGTAKLAFADKGGVISNGLNTTVQALSGTGSLRIGAAFLQRFYPGSKVVYISTPSWGNHYPIFKDSGMDFKNYRYYDKKTCGFDAAGCFEDLSNIPDKQKYNLLISRNEKQSKIRQQPWYCERLNAKYKKKHLSTQTWTFIKEDLNDGYKGEAESQTVVGGGTVVSEMEPKEIQNTKMLEKKLVSKSSNSNKDSVYLKSLVRTHKNRERIKGFEKELLSHPLVFSSGIKESLPPELYEDLVNILDPSLNIKDDNIELSNTSENTQLSEEVSHCSVSNSTKIDALAHKEPCSGYHEAIQSASNIISRKKVEDHLSRDEKRAKGKKTPINQTSKIEIVTKDFCDWVHNLGGEANNISETKINELFASSCEAKPSLTIPVQVIELTTVPSELCVGGQYPLSADSLDYDAQKPLNMHNPLKTKYGAWYLDPKTWYQEHKSSFSKQPLLGPNNISTDISEEIKNEELNQVLSSLHAVKVFREFIEKKGFRNPEFLKDVPLNDDDNAHIVADSSK